MNSGFSGLPVAPALPERPRLPRRNEQYEKQSEVHAGQLGSLDLATQHLALMLV